MKKTASISLALMLALVILPGCNAARKTDTNVDIETGTREETPNTNDTTTDDEMDEDDMIGVMMEDGEMVTVWMGGATAEMTEEVTLTDGSEVSLDGKVTSEDGDSYTLEEGQLLKMDGTLATEIELDELLDTDVSDTTDSADQPQGSQENVNDVMDNSSEVMQ